jgi:peptidoglycan-associated lipoprotein
MTIETLRRIALSLAVAGILIIAGCRKHVTTNTPAALATPPSPPPAPTVTLNASPSSIVTGGSSTLTWTSSNANQLTLSPGNGSVAAQGAQRVSPNDSTTYTIRAKGPGGETTAAATVEVSRPVTAPEKMSSTGDQSFAANVKDAFFDFNKSDVRPDARQALTGDAEYLRTHAQINITVEGHCDDRGGEEYNLALGDLRAAAAKQYLVSEGISPNRIQTVSLGKEKPFCTADNEQCWQENRRGHVVGNQ